MKKRIFVFGLLLLLLTGGLGVGVSLRGAEVPGSDSRPVKMLVISSFHFSHPFSREICLSLMKAMEDNHPNAVFDYLELNTQRNRLFDFESKFKPSLELIQTGHYQIVVTILDDAALLLCKYAHTIPDSVPLVIYAPSNVYRQLKARHPNTTGVCLQFALPETLDMALTLMPNAKEIFIPLEPLIDSSLFKTPLDKVLQQHPGLEEKVKFYNGGNTRVMLDMAEKLPKGSFILFPPWYSYAKEGFASLEAVNAELVKKGRPVFVLTDVLLGQGVIGGVVAWGPYIGEDMAQLVLKVLADQGDAVNKPFTLHRQLQVADMRAISKFKFDARRLGSNVLLLNRQPPFWEAYPLEFGFGIALVMLFLFAWLIHIRIVRAVNARNVDIFRSLPVTTGVVDRDFNLLFFHSDEPWIRQSLDIRNLRDLREIDHDRIVAFFERVFRTGENLSFDYQIHNTKRAITVAPIDKNIFGQDALVWISHDNSELQNARMQAQHLAAENEENVRKLEHALAENSENVKKLQDSVNLWNAVVDSLPFYIFVKAVDDNYRYLISNKGFERLTGKANIVGRFDKDLFRLEDAESFRRKDEQIIAAGITEDFSETMIAPDGSLRSLWTLKKPILSSNGTRMLLGLGMDNTEKEDLKRKENESRLLLQTLLDTLPTGVIVKDADNDFRCVTCNPAYSRIVNRSPMDLIGKNDAEAGIFEPAAILRHREDDCLAMRTNERFHTRQNYFFEHSGHCVYEKFKIPLQLPDGRKLLIVTYSDITALNELIENERIINTNLELLLASENPEENVTQILELICKHLNADMVYFFRFCHEKELITLDNEYPPNSMYNLTHVSEFKLDTSDKWYKIYQRKGLALYPDCSTPEALESLGVYGSFVRPLNIHSIHGSGIYVDDKLYGSLSIVHHKRNVTFNEPKQKFLRSLARLFGLMLDRSLDRKALREALEQAQNANKAKSFFLASVSHEIRTPLNAVIGLAELLQDDSLSRAVQKEYLSSITYAGEALLQLINDVLDLSKLEANQMIFNLEKTHLGTFCRECFDLFSQRISAKGLARRLELPAVETVFIDRLRLRQILFNLLGNAVKFTDEGEIRLEVTFRRDSDSVGTLIFNVEDTGMGIAESEQKSLFEPFVQSKLMRGTYAANKGTGLGLSISRRLTEKMGGEIQLESEPGKGSSFRVILQNVQYENQRMELSVPKTSEVLATTAGKRVLLVDDVIMNLKVLAALLTKLGLETRTALSGHEALDLLSKEHFDMVMTDLWMPEMDGLGLLTRIKANPALASIPVFAVTGDIEADTNFTMNGFNGTLLKPVSTEKIRELFSSSSEV